LFWKPKKTILAYATLQVQNQNVNIANGGAMCRVLHVLLLVFLLSNAYAAQDISSPAENSAGTDARAGANDTSPDGSFSTDASASDASKKSQHPDRFYRASQLVFIGSMMADVGTTWSFPKGKVEANPLLGRNKAQQASVSSALALFILLDAHLLHIRGNTRTAKYLLWIGTGAHVFAVLYNTR
jgi:hypothetical protein